MSNIQLIVGLGNPGPEYVATRHNAGFWFVEALANAHGATLRMEKGFHGLVATATIGGRKVWLLEPQTWMNRSGVAVAAIATFYKVLPDAILVVHDELDFLPGTVKLKQGGSSAGHNGLKDISARIGPDYWRLRIGIGHPRSLALNQEVADFVLHRPNREHQTAIDGAIDRALDVVPLLVGGEITEGIKRLHTAA